MKLGYLSSRTPGYKSILRVTLTHSTIPFNLMKVHLMVAVEGRLFRKWFPAAPNLSYDFVWDKADVYSQKVYGLSEAFGKWQSALCIAQTATCIFAPFIQNTFVSLMPVIICFFSFPSSSICGFWVWVMSRPHSVGEEDCGSTGLRNHSLQTGRMDRRQAPCSKYPEWWVSL